MIPRNTMAYINVELSGTIIGGTTGFEGKVGFFEYYSVVTNIGGKKGHSGTTGGTTSKAAKDTDFPLPTVNITTSDNTGGYLKLSVTHSGDNITNWFAKVRVLIQPVGNPKSIANIGVTAIYQNGAGILFQDNGMLLWN